MKKFFNYLTRWQVMLACIGFLMRGCIEVVFRSIRGTATREKTNQSLYNNSIKILASAKAKYKITYQENFKYIENLPRIYISNHLSLFDAPLFYATLSETIRVITKKELTKVPIMGKAIIDSEQIIIDRKIPASSQNFYQNAKDKLSNGISIWIFSEGTRSRTGKLLPLKKGGFRLACEAGAQIIPAGIIGTDHILQSKKALPHLHQDIELRLGEPIDAREFNTPEGQQILLEKVTETIKSLCVPSRKALE